ncbi:tRNA(Met) cytidine acetate ligase [Paenibacillus jilunlii]|uniref:tRNA(Met) cytidine acetate ligase n=1 Tax=Paenibacillus jilunlii TaxID=682956 RepID=A0A1G9HD27_9BACL|nr:nucleotidyltransferase family protein [Paenibacillus jilunlii]KWX69629.1 nucleotidyltransferase [Paenibacillus jilunlii]SDL10809.1 Predicted nucleotidyltransferase [Paenibacillus jilunlii]
MTTVGIIAEYNPLHNGHVHHFAEAKRLSGADRSIVIMSGPFTQRGEPAAVSKQARTEMALHMGADVVIELPVAYAVQPAEWFAFGAVALLEATGVVDSLCFGSEAGTLSALQPMAEFLADESSALQGEIRRRMALGKSFPAAYSAAAASAWEASLPEEERRPGAAGLLRQPNNSLGLHYLIALRRLGSKIRPLTAPRIGAGFHDPLQSGSPIASATAIRRLLSEGGSPAAYMPDYSMSILEREHAAGRGPLNLESFRIPLRHLLATRTAAELHSLQDMNEGLENRLLRVLPGLPHFTVSGLLEALKSKRYTRTRLQRLLIHALLNHSKQEMAPAALAQGPGYIRILGFRESGRQLLKQMKLSAAWPVLTSPAQFSHPMLERDLQAAAAYAGAFVNPSRADLYRDYLEPPVRI